MTSIFFFRFPFYYEVKILLLIWLISPVSRGSLGSSIIYRKFVHPNLMKKEDEIDRWMQRLRMQVCSQTHLRRGHTLSEHAALVEFSETQPCF